MAHSPSFPHPDSVIPMPDGRVVEVKVHGCLWDDRYLENSLAAVEACYQAGVARAEIDLAMLRDEDFLIIHDLVLDEATTGSGPVAQLDRQAAQRLRLDRAAAVRGPRPPLTGREGKAEKWCPSGTSGTMPGLPSRLPSTRTCSHENPSDDRFGRRARARRLRRAG